MLAIGNGVWGYLWYCQHTHLFKIPIKLGTANNPSPLGVFRKLALPGVLKKIAEKYFSHPHIFHFLAPHRRE